ncbi:Myb-like DNA-binding domain protein (macronuclear) [Tetrahymena thermophila SB210]|uniref:Myb-like DNA-binding domain protein n=1 Tax=Tetrahymena thermophila (strain SB210) TaxID=312017 RepID=I7MJW7_TETTS|nr:Myb-like DNA-binding domain protein [Tetrahymena thermophila SB210]EAR97265.1 Myb-like DNA-binding domain protein [Tetrahymena thermophila SB210]|eukprot:XP_001017510.1 Myb-like DNA-binding domain protein [Tetrahymena thermophila SB210]
MISKTSGKGPWSFDEDNKLLDWVKANGPQKWSLCSETIPGRSGKQCRERWFNNLNPNVKKGNWTAEEDDMIFQGYLQHGSSWSRIAKNLEGRTENSVKNRFYSTVRKLLSDSEKNGGKGSEQQIRNIIQMSLGKKVGGGMPSLENENDQNSDNSQCESEEDKSHNDAMSSSKNNQSSEVNTHKEAEAEEAKKEEISSKSQNLEGQTNKKQSKQAPQSSSSNNNNDMELEEPKPETKKNGNEAQNNESEKLKQNTQSLADDLNQEGEGHEDETSSHAISSSQQLGLSGMTKRKYNRKRHQDEYSESNLLYRLLKSNDVTIKNTKCLQDYSVFYRKYKQNKYMMKKKKKEDDAKKQNENGDEEHTSSSMQETNQQDYNEEDEDDDNSHLQFQDLTSAKIKKALKSKLGMKGCFDDKQKISSSKDSSHKNRQDSENDLDEINHQLLLLKQAKLQQQDKLKKKLKANNQSKVEDLNQISTKIKNAKIQSKTKKGHHSDEDEDSNLDHIHTSSIKEEPEEDNDDDNSAQLSGANKYDDKLFNSNLPSENQLDDVGDLESQLLKFFQKSMGQFFKKFMKQNKGSGKETDKKTNNKKELKKQLSQQQQQQQQQLLQLQVQEQIQKQLEQLNNQNSKQSKNINNQQVIQRTNTIIQNPPIKNQSKKNGSSQIPAKDSNINDNGIQNLIQKQIQEMQLVKQEENQENNDQKQKQENNKTGFKQNNNSNSQQMMTKSTINNQKSSFQLNKNQNTPTARNGYTNQIGSSSSLFSQPNNNNNNNNYNLNNNNGGFGSLLSSHSLQMQQQNQNNQQLTASQNLSIQNIKNLLNQNMLGNQNSLNVNGDQGVDQKMIFLLNQLNTLESMLTNTKKELVKLEASLMNQRGSDQQMGINQNRGGYASNNMQGSSNNLYASNGFYNMQGGIPPTANVLKTLPSFGSRAIFEKSDVDAPSFNKRKNSKDNTSQFSDFDKFINNNN